MAIGFGRTPSHDVTRLGLRLAPRQARGRWLVALALLALMLASGVGIGWLLHERTLPVVAAPPPGPSLETRQLRQQLEEARMGARLADARSHELERQIDALNQKLTESQDELTFIRKAREGKH
jgi:hypothetical protein